MVENLNLAPLQELLTTGISPKNLAEELDDLLYDYMEMSINLQTRKRENDDDFIYAQTLHFIFRIRELRNVFWKCEE